MDNYTVYVHINKLNSLMYFGITCQDNPNARKVNQYDLKDNFIRSYWGCMEVKELYGYDNSRIAKCCKGKVKTSYGYIWRYADE